MMIDSEKIAALQRAAENAPLIRREPPRISTFSKKFLQALDEYRSMPKCDNPDCADGELRHGGFCDQCEAGRRRARQREEFLSAAKEAERKASLLRLEKTWGPLEIPPEFRNLPTLTDAFGRAIAREKEEAIKAAKNIVEGTAKNPLKVFYGPVGTGKSALAAKVAEAMGHGLFITMTGFLDELTGSGFEEKLAKMRAAQTCPLLILDDLCNPEPEASRNGKGWDVKRLTQWQREKLLDLLDHRIKWHLPTIITTNLTGTLDFIELQLRQQLDERLADRLICQFHWVEMGGANLRRATRKGV